MAKEEFIQRHRKKVFGMRANGASIEQIANALKVTRSTFFRFLREHPDFRREMEDSRVAVLGEVRGKLYELALGLAKTVEKTEYFDARGNKINETIRTTKHAPSLRAVACILQRFEQPDVADTVDGAIRKIDADVNPNDSEETKRRADALAEWWKNYRKRMGMKDGEVRSTPADDTSRRFMIPADEQGS